MRAHSLAMALATALLATEASAASCDYLNTKTDAFADGPCKIEQTSKGYRLAIPGLPKPVVIQQGPHQGQFHRWKLNGRAATFYELDRGSFCGTTDDLTENVCFSSFR
ncbi:hypothetical protein ACLNGM_15110 [Aureimonas phyllosphaerae]|uniref:hypothetical protein n=1 Tax=Aureimonas phyllosphaerae TaxID=1166078 RepID=UPI003A5C499B